jgi:hypothetical protein
LPDSDHGSISIALQSQSWCVLLLLQSRFWHQNNFLVNLMMDKVLTKAIRVNETILAMLLTLDDG